MNIEEFKARLGAGGARPKRVEGGRGCHDEACCSCDHHLWRVGGVRPAMTRDDGAAGNPRASMGAGGRGWQRLGAL